MIRLESLTKRFPDGHVAVDHLDLEVDEGEVVILLGPSGCGKTTTLKMINRLVEPTSGRIFLDDDDVTTVDPVRLRRRIGYVIQQVGLFPHHTVAQNIGTVPRLLGWPKADVRRRVDELLELVGLEAGRFRSRYPHQLSGGQRQRIGVARALGADPPVLLMDEPFGALDPITRDRLQHEFAALQQRLGKTVVFVTHDVEEAVRLGDRIAIMEQGADLQQFDTPAAILADPATPFVADFVGADRGLKRLAVVAVPVDSMESPPTVTPAAEAGDARRAMDDAGTDFALVVDGSRLVGWVPRKHAEGVQPVGRFATPVTEVVRPDATLRDAFAAMLLHDADWVAVVDGDRYLGVLTAATLHQAARRDE